ncbi:MAG: DUF3644 domain-containing protein [Acidobacteriota bacterium]
MIAAIDVYNKPDFPYRAESFTILALNGWELLLKAKWLADHHNQLRSLYVPEDRSKDKRAKFKRGRSGNPLTHTVDFLARKLTEAKVLDEKARCNLELLCELRDTSIHFYHRSEALAERVQEVGMATLKNFVTAAKDWFDADLSRFNFYLMPLAFVSPPAEATGLPLSREEKSFLRYLEAHKAHEDDPAGPYSVAIRLEVRFVRSKATDAAAVRVTTDPKAPAVRLTEEQFRERYPWDYGELTKRCRERYADFKVDKKYHQIRKGFEQNERFVHIRRLDPGNPRSAKKPFFAPTILQEIDNHYRKR